MNRELLKMIYLDSNTICEEKASNEAWVWEEEFAKQIISECIDVLYNMDSSPAGWRKDAIGAIYERFGL